MGIIESIRDITELKHAGQALRESEEGMHFLQTPHSKKDLAHRVSEALVQAGPAPAALRPG